MGGKSVRHPPHVPCLFSYILEGHLLGSKCRHNTYPHTASLAAANFVFILFFSISYIYILCAVATTIRRKNSTHFLGTLFISHEIRTAAVPSLTLSHLIFFSSTRRGHSCIRSPVLKRPALFTYSLSVLCI